MSQAIRDQARKVHDEIINTLDSALKNFRQSIKAGLQELDSIITDKEIHKMNKTFDNARHTLNTYIKKATTMIQVDNSEKIHFPKKSDEHLPKPNS